LSASTARQRLPTTAPAITELALDYVAASSARPLADIDGARSASVVNERAPAFDAFDVLGALDAFGATLIESWLDSVAVAIATKRELTSGALGSRRVDPRQCTECTERIGS
jgi:hypothetical protein